jgi:hypothetical protein
MYVCRWILLTSVGWNNKLNANLLRAAESLESLHSRSSIQAIPRVLQKLTVHYLVQRPSRWNISWARWIQFTPSQPIYTKLI